jgi:hypothetical protein
VVVKLRNSRIIKRIEHFPIPPYIPWERSVFPTSYSPAVNKSGRLIDGYNIPPQEKKHKELSLGFLKANMSVPCSHLLIGQSNVVVDFHPGNVEPHCASEAALDLG